MTRDRKPNRTADQVVADLEAKIAAVRAREERKALNADPGRRYAKLALSSLRRAVASTEDATLKTGLSEIVPSVERCLGVVAAPTSAKRRRGRADSNG